MTTLRRHLTWLSLVIICLTGTITACSNTASRPRPATFDGDMRLASKSKEFYSQHRVVTLDDHDLYQRGSARSRDERINCLLRDCRLQPGQHSTDVEYRWSSMEAEKKLRQRQTRAAFGILLGGGEAVPDLNFPCHASVSFEVQSAHDYLLNVVHTDQSVAPEEFQIVDTESGAVVGSARPRCY